MIIRLLGQEPPGLFLAARVLWMVVVFVFIGGAVQLEPFEPAGHVQAPAGPTM